jgi:hypothetical protein
MSRPLRIEPSGAVYHVTSRGERRERIFVDDDASVWPWSSCCAHVRLAEAPPGLDAVGLHLRLLGREPVSDPDVAQTQCRDACWRGTRPWHRAPNHQLILVGDAFGTLTRNAVAAHRSPGFRSKCLAPRPTPSALEALK